jgi:tRNA A-37 threonylcarbamoyl transferase component Bud32
MTDASAIALPDDMLAFLAGAGMLKAGAKVRAEPLTGGVSSDIWRVEVAGEDLCIKRALAQLRVAADWRAPVERNAFEALWLRDAGRILPGAAPALLASDAQQGMLAMVWLSPADHRLWKADLLAGKADPSVAAAVGTRLAALHSGFARDPDAPARYRSDDIFRAIRIEPYLGATAAVHPDLAAPLADLAARLAGTRRSVVHGDVSPKNILIGPDGPMFLDAECAWFGDPAFDLAFCLNHMLLKCLAAPQAVAGFVECYDALAAGYLSGVDWEPRAELEARAAALLPALFLARVDGKSPVEYLRGDADRAAVRRVARPLIASPPQTLSTLRDAWATDRNRNESTP